MKVLFTQHSLVYRGGSELFVIETAKALQRAGHDVAVYAGAIGPVADELRSQGIPVLPDPRLCPWIPDVIHGQHRVHALKALAAFPRTPAILHVHGFIPVLEKPFIHPRILRYVVISPGSVEFWSRDLGVERGRFQILLNGIDLFRFASVRQPPDLLRSALLYSNSSPQARELSEIDQACTERGVRLQKAGLCTGQQEKHPEQLLPQFDLVFASGRSALEAAASGCAVIPLSGHMAEELLTASNYQRLRGQNMAPSFFSHHQVSKEWIGRQIDAWDAGKVAAATTKVREDCAVCNHVGELETLYGQVVAEFRDQPPVDLEVEFEAIASVMVADASTRVTELQERLRSMAGHWSWRLRHPLRLIHQALRAVNAALRGLKAKTKAS